VSHRDGNCHTTSALNAQSLRAAFEWLLRGVQTDHIVFRQEARATPGGLMLTALLWVWSGKSTLGRRLAQAQRIAGWLDPAGAGERVSQQAFMKRLVRWTGPLIAALADALRARMQTALKSCFDCEGYAVFGVDGSRLELPRTTSNEARFSPASSRTRRTTRRSGKSSRQSAASRRKKAQRPQAWITTLWHAGSGLPWDWRIGPSDSSERAHLMQMIDILPEHALVTADAGFVGYDYWAALIGSGREFVIRVGSNVKLLKKLGYAESSRQTVSLWPDKAAKRQQPPLVLRLVVVHDGKQPWYLVTSLRDPKQFADQQVANVYRLRWGIELYYRHFKQTFERRKLKSHKAEHAECEAQWCMVGLWALLLHAKVHLHKRHIDPSRLSVAQALDAYRTAMHEFLMSPEAGESLTDRLSRSVIDDYHRRNKSSRDYPRKKSEAPPGSPQLINATPKQRTLARQLARSLQDKRLTA
jgi:hypothetical protein